MLTLYISSFIAFLKSAVMVVGYISNNSLFPEPLTSEEEKIYLEKYSQGDEEARNILIERNLRLVAHVCKKYASTNVEQDDLISIGTIGLIKGIKSFNMDKGVRLATYVSRCIENEILMYLRASKKTNAEVYLEDTIGKDKDDNTVSLQEVLESNEKSIEDDQGRQRCQIALMLPPDVVPDHVSRTKQEVHEGTLRIIVEKRDAVESTLIEILLSGFGASLRPGQETEFLPDEKRPSADCQSIFFHGHAKVGKIGPINKKKAAHPCRKAAFSMKNKPISRPERDDASARD